ncbi:hypothetical protein AAU57_02835 [Nonlabens sp. YIK11]|uniref:sulfatase-like hydrolase/transferase n=1 Tax=Nonlabens sp. YIK11 TaxID=1453349 RepID=UPI0006DCE441|nr:sulfatase-like hydrolase/transferase [Nonlabens sp. YIK11]KQC32383.1 hypothetical protein AAU57_02835 [Nonlabens sp. YIK11]
MLYFQIILLVILFVSLLTILKNKMFKSIGALLGGIFISLQVVSIYLTNNIGDYKFYEHFKWSVVSNIYQEFLPEFLLAVCFLVIITFILYWLSSILSKLSSKISVPTSIICTILLSLNSHVFYNLYETISLKSGNSYTLTKAISKLPLQKAELLTNRDVSASAGRNIIFLSLESFEKGFINERPDLTPHLNQLKKEYHYYDLLPSSGGGWTSASAYMALTGMPAYFGNKYNDIFQGSNKIQINNIGNVLETAGYDMQYLIANKDFSGMKDMLETLGFNVKSEDDFETKYEKIPWGIHDKDLFDEIEKEAIALSEKERPFALFASTISTHYPDGIYDSRMESLIAPKNSELEFMVAAVDYYIGNLFSTLKEKNLLENTTVIIVPDHQFMGKHKVIDDLEDRGLFVLSTTPIDEMETKNLSQVSMPNIVLDVADIETDAVFLDDLIQGNKNQFVYNYKKELRDVNIASLNTITMKDGFNVVRMDSLISVAYKNDSNLIFAQTDLTKASKKLFQINVDRYFRYYSSRHIPIADIKTAVKKPNTINIIYVNDTIHTYYSDQDGLVSFKKDANRVVFENTELIPKFQFLQPSSNEEELDKKLQFLVIRSSGFNSKETSYYQYGGNTYRFSRGVNVISINSKGSYTLENFDTYANYEARNELLTYLKQIKKSKFRSFIIVHDTAGEVFGEFEQELNAIGLFKLIDIKNRQAYIASYEQGGFLEYLDDFTIEKKYAVPNLKLEAKRNTDDEITTYSKQVDRFIAHAGGKIDGKVYTNSLEALNKSYQAGFRLFELDIIKTSDGHFVAAHDWDTWKRLSNYSGETPVTLKIFNSQKLFGEYTPLDMTAINSWFETHKDAILVTDKTREIKRFSTEFLDKSRLIMEVFNVEDAELASVYRVEPILSESIIASMNLNLVPFMKDRDFKYITFSRNSISKFKGVLKMAKENGIKSYVYHVNFQGGKDEKYVVEYELGQVYGLYADEWDFKTPE